LEDMVATRNDRSSISRGILALVGRLAKVFVLSSPIVRTERSVMDRLTVGHLMLLLLEAVLWLFVESLSNHCSYVCVLRRPSSAV
jgi:hypothetical protein